MAIYRKAKRGAKRTANRIGSGVWKDIKTYTGNRYGRDGNYNYGQIARDALAGVNMLKGLINTEKKRYESNSINAAFIGQVQNNAGLQNYWELTPTPSIGTGYGGREGSSILLKSMYMACQATGQASQSSRIKGKIYIVMTKGGDAFDMTQFLQYNPFVYAQDSVAVYDLESARNPDFFKKYKVIRSKRFTLIPDAQSGNISTSVFKVGLKFKKGLHIRYQGNGNTATGVRLFAVVVADSGNVGGSTSTLHVPVTAATTGGTLAYNSIAYYIDN